MVNRTQRAHCRSPQPQGRSLQGRVPPAPPTQMTKGIPLAAVVEEVDVALPPDTNRHPRPEERGALAQQVVQG